MTLRDLVPALGKKRVPVRYDYDPFRLFTDDMNRLFDDFFSGFDVEPFGRRLSTFSPGIEVSDNEKEVKVSAELPGMNEKDIELTLTDNRLTISGEKKAEKEDSGKDYMIKERSYGSFRRSIPIDAEIDTAKIDAHFKKGVLTVRLPKTGKEIERKKKISISVE